MTSKRQHSLSPFVPLPVLFRTISGQYLPEVLHAMILDYASGSDFHALCLVSHSSHQLVNRNLSKRKTLFFDDSQGDCRRMMHLALKYCRRLTSIRLSASFDDDARLVSDLPKLVQNNAPSLQDLLRSTDYVDPSSALVEQLSRCASLRSVQLGADDEAWESAHEIAALPSLRSLIVTPELTHLVIVDDLYDVVAGLSCFTSLVSLAISFNLFDNAGFDALQCLQSLTHLDLAVWGHAFDERRDATALSTMRRPKAITSIVRLRCPSF